MNGEKKNEKKRKRILITREELISFINVRTLKGNAIACPSVCLSFVAIFTTPAAASS